MKGAKQRGFLLLELLLVLTLFSLTITLSVTALKPRGFQEHVRDVAFLNRLKGAILEQRIRCVREPGIGYNFVLPGNGTVLFYRQGSLYLKLAEPDYQVWIEEGVPVQIQTFWDFKSRTKEGNNGFTISIFKKGQLLAKLIYQVGTSTFREEFYAQS